MPDRSDVKRDRGRLRTGITSPTPLGPAGTRPPRIPRSFPALTRLLEHRQPPLGLLQGQHEGGLGRVEAEAALIVALPGEVVIDAGGRRGRVVPLPLPPGARRGGGAVSRNPPPAGQGQGQG